MDNTRKKLQFDELELIRLCKEGLTDLELADYFKCSYTCIAKYRRNLKIPSNRKSINHFDISKEDLVEMVKSNLSDSEIGRKYNVYASTVYAKRKIFNISRQSRTENKEIKLTEIQKQVLFGCVLGDGYLNKVKSKNTKFEFSHSLKQKEYVDYKFGYFYNFPGRTYYFTRKPHKITGISYETYTGSLQTNKSFNYFWDHFYSKTVKKRIPIELLDKYYTPLAMAIHFMDDGSFHSRCKNGSGSAHIATCGFDRDELELFSQFLFKKYSIENNVDKYNRIYIKTSSLRHFMDLIRPYIIESMQYKLMKDVS